MPVSGQSVYSYVFSLCLFVCIYFIVWITSCTNGDLNPSNFVRSCIFGGLKLNDCVRPTFSQRFTSRSYPQAYTVIQIPFFKWKSWEGDLLWLKEVMMTLLTLKFVGQCPSNLLVWHKLWSGCALSVFLMFTCGCFPISEILSWEVVIDLISPPFLFFSPANYTCIYILHVIKKEV